MRRLLVDSVRSALGSGSYSFEGRSLADSTLADIEHGGVHVLVLSVCYRGLQKLEKRFTRSLGRVFEDSQRFVRRLVADKVENYLNLAGSNAHIVGLSNCLQCIILHCYTLLSTDYLPLFDVLEPA